MAVPIREVFKLDLYSDVSVSLCLFKNVKNGEELKKMAVEGEIEGSLLNSKLVLEPFQVLVAVNKAVHYQKHNKLHTRNIYTEIIYSMSITKRIAESLKKFGIGDNHSSFLLVLLNDENDEKLTKFQTTVVGQSVELSELTALANIEEIKKAYDIEEQELETGTLLDSIVSRIAAKEIKIK